MGRRREGRVGAGSVVRWIRFPSLEAGGSSALANRIVLTDGAEEGEGQAYDRRKREKGGGREEGVKVRRERVERSSSRSRVEDGGR